MTKQSMTYLIWRSFLKYFAIWNQTNLIFKDPLKKKKKKKIFKAITVNWLKSALKGKNTFKDQEHF